MRVMKEYRDREVCIVGLGYVGLTLAVAMAEVGFRVRGVEIDSRIVKCVNSGTAHFSENGLNPRLATQVALGNLVASTEWPEPGDVTVFVVTVGTPLMKGEKSTDLGSITSVATKLGSTLRPHDLVILRSTVRVGVSRDLVKATLDKFGVPYDLAFCPERTLEGRALIELRTLPQIIGGLNEASTMRASQLFSFLTPTIVRVPDLETAEMVKLINNTQRDLMFAFANEVAGMCDSVGVSSMEVIRSGNMGYPRASMPIPGPVGGPCLEKDPFILTEGVKMRGGSSRLPLLGREIHEELPYRTAEILAEELAERRPSQAVKKIVVVGVAFKGRPETSDLRGTLAIPLLTALKEHFPAAEIAAYDPAVPFADIGELGYLAYSNVDDAVADADALIFQTNNPKFEKLNIEELSSRMNEDGVIYDLWNQFDPEIISLSNCVAYFGLGTRVLGKRRHLDTHKNRAGDVTA